MEKGKALRFNEGKIPLDLITPFFQQEIAKVLDFGAKKYGKYNWISGMSWSKVIASMKRHIHAFEQGEDIDQETGYTYHLAHVAINCMFLLDYMKNYPMGDDRNHSYLNRFKISLDIDGVLANFGKAYKQRILDAGLQWYPYDEQVHWNFPYKSNKVWEKILKDKDFWINLEPLCDPHLPFEPIGYVTSRFISQEWTEEWLVKWGFPSESVFTVGKESKAVALAALGADIFVDDNFHNFVDLNKKGICTYLFDQPYNRKYDVGYRRLFSLKELVS